jgi:catechol 2,3-dioxygenase-like lactoylglutathione lyase family enzyme
MAVKGLDRVVVMVRDMDKARRVFSEKFGMEFLELQEQISMRDGLRSCVCRRTHLHLLSPILPLRDHLPPPMMRRIGQLKDHEYVCVALVFKVEAAVAAGEELERQGLRLQRHRYAKSHDYASIGLDDFEEVMFMEEDTLGVTIGLAEYAGVGAAQDGPGPRRGLGVTGLDRIIVMVRDMQKALDLFSSKLGLHFRETAPEVQLQAGNRGLVCHEAHLHLVQPNDPLPPTAPPPLRMAAELLKQREAMIMLLVFKVPDARSSASRSAEVGLTVIRSWEDDHDYAAVGIDNLFEYLFDPADTLGLPVCVSTWD